MEIDLYWFDPVDIKRYADILWTRYAPLFRDVRGYKGFVLSVGISANFILTFDGDPDQVIALPDTSGQEVGFPISGQLQGDTAARQAAWRARFAGHPSTPQTIVYGRWTYRALRALTDALRARARQGGVNDFRVAVMAVGQDTAYGDPIPFAKSHPEAFTPWRERAEGAISSSSHLDPANLLRADEQPLAAYPRGIPDGLPVHALFAAQWGAVADTAGLDGLMLRDSFSFPRPYDRRGPFGRYIPNAAAAERMTGGLASLVRGVKRAAPRTLVMMYSTAATATSDWRANGIDLERVAREGNVDIFVDQTWAGAWGEVGVRQQTFWNAPILGWTYQLGNFLQHAAVLGDTRVRHYPLVETFDAWESWDTIHTARDRLRWSLWAYSHAGVKTPRGLKMPAGSYIAWGNRGRDLLSEADVAWLSEEMNAAARDAAETVDIAGPTMVYSREAAAGQIARLSPRFDPRDQIDEQVGSIIKWPLPILSATRAEWMRQVKSDLFLFGATTDLPAEQIAAVERMAAQGQPMAFFGGVSSATHPAFARLLSVSNAPHRPSVQDVMLRATAGPMWPSGTVGIGAFDAPPPATRIKAPAQSVVYRFIDSTGLVQDKSGGRNLALWDPVPIFDYWYRPLRDLMNGDPSPFALTAAVLNDQLRRAGALAASTIDQRQTGTIAAWTLADGRTRLLAGNLEEGLRDNADRSTRITLRLPRNVQRCGWQSVWQTESLPAGKEVTLRISSAGSSLFNSDCERSSSTGPE